MTATGSRLRSERRPSPADDTATTTVALLPIAADLLPSGTTSAHGGRRSRFVAVGLVGATVLAVGGAWFAAVESRSGAQDALASAQDRQRSLQLQQRDFDQLVSTQTQTAALSNALRTLMATDASWSELLAGLGKVRGGVTFTSLDAGVVDPSAGGGDATAKDSGALATPGAIGQLTVSGTAADKPTVAAFVEALGGVPGLADPFLTTVTALSSGAGGNGFSFTVTVALTDGLRSGSDSRWATTPTTTGGGK